MYFPPFACNVTIHINLPAYARASGWNAMRLLFSTDLLIMTQKLKTGEGVR